MKKTNTEDIRELKLRSPWESRAPKKIRATALIRSTLCLCRIEKGRAINLCKAENVCNPRLCHKGATDALECEQVYNSMPRYALTAAARTVRY